MAAERFLVLGSNSFSGAHFVDGALGEGAVVMGLSRSPEPHPVFLPYRQRAAREGAFFFRQADLNTDLDRIMGLAAEFRPDYVVNFAAQSMVAESWRNPGHWFRTNTLANVLLHDRLRELPGLKKYVHVSTPEVYGHCEGLITEEAPLRPSTPYAVSRAAADLSLLSFHRAYDFPVVFSRAANVFGPGQQLYRIVPRTALFICQGRRIPLHGGGRSVRSFIHIRDVVDGTLRLARAGQPPGIYHFSTPRHHSIREVVAEVCRQMGVALEDHVEVTDERLGKDAAYTLDSGKATRELGFAPARTFEDGVRETIAWVDENFAVLDQQPTDYVHRP
jgi:dTDP-glucose 4,6-dehydratase